MYRSLAAIVIFGAAALFSAADGASYGPELWFCPRPLVVSPPSIAGGAGDYFSLFESPESWPTVFRHVKVFKIYQRLIQNGDERQLAQMFSFLKTSNIALALEIGFLTDSDTCGRGVEGYTGRFVGDIARKIKRLGGEVAIVDMDEPLWYGVEFDGPKACHNDVTAVATDAAKHLAELRSVFPSVKVGDTEPILGNPKYLQWIQTIEQWSKAFELASGRKLEFFHADVVWSSQWQKPLQKVSETMRAQGVAFGVIYNSDDRDASNLQAMEGMLARAKLVEAIIPLPSQIVFQSWQKYPNKVVPENEVGTMTSTVLRYIKEHGG